VCLLPLNAVLLCLLPQDWSSNGTFLNGRRLGRGCATPLADGDRVSLVLSVAPLAEQAFTFHAGRQGRALGVCVSSLAAWHAVLQPLAGS
jgi:pSer/pThr/pTyr-binding forkhead associated (FHA) protein